MRYSFTFSDFPGAGFKPFLLFFGKFRRKRLVHPPVIGVEPLPVRFVKKGGVYCVQVDGDQGKRFKAQESPIVCLLSLTACLLYTSRCV